MEKKDEIRYMECLSINSTGITIYREYLRPRVRLEDEANFEVEDRTETNDSGSAAGSEQTTTDRFRNNGYISRHSAKKISSKINWLLFLSAPKKNWSTSAKRWVKFRVCFVTLTLPSAQVHSDEVIKSKCLNQLLVELRKYHSVKLYLWRAEKQANGNIHFHIVTDHFIEADVLRARWNRIINKLGYVDHYCKSMRESVKCFADYYNKFLNQGSYKTLMRRYNKGVSDGWTNPNTTDIHSVSKIKNLSAYLCKYMSKNIENIDELSEQQKTKLLVSGMLWGLSESLSKIKNIQIPVDSKVFNDINKIFDTIKSYVYKDDFFTYKAIGIVQFYRNCSTFIRQKIHDVIRDAAGFEYSNNLLLA